MIENSFGDEKLKNIFNYFSQFKAINFKKNEIIFRPGLPNTNIFFIENGYVKTYTISENGEEKIVMFYENHNLFPLVKLFKNSLKNVFAQAISNTTIRCVSELEFQKFLDKDKTSMKEFMNYILDFVEIYSQRIQNLGFITAYPRVICCLLNLGKRFGVIDKNHVKLEIPITQRELASTIAMTRETVSREFEKLVKEEIVEMKNHGIIIKDIKKLEKIMEKYGEDEIF